MQKSIVVEILKSLDWRERQEFKDYVFSPFFNKNEKVHQLCNYLFQYLPDFDSSDLTKQNAYFVVYQSKEYQELRLNNVISDLLQLLYTYLVYKRQEGQRFRQAVGVVDALVARRLVRPVPRLLRRIEQLREKETHQSLYFYQSEYILSENRYEYALLQNQLEDSETLQSISDSLDIYYWCNKLRIACEMLSRAEVRRGAYNSRFLDTFLTYYEQQPDIFKAYPVLQTYYETYRFLQNADEDKYKNLSVLLQQHYSLFPPKELRHLYTLLLNYCVRQINFGHSIYYKEILRIYDILIAQKLLLQDSHLTKWSFMNATTAGIRSKAYAWTQTFIEQYKNYLPEKDRQNTVDYQLAALYFAKGELKEALQWLQRVEFSDIFYHASAKLIQLKVYYELGEIEPFYALVRASLNVLRRSRKLSDYHKASYSNFVKLTKKLHDIKISRKRNVRTKLHQFESILMNTSPLASKGWLSDQYEILLQKEGLS